MTINLSFSGIPGFQSEFNDLIGPEEQRHMTYENLRSPGLKVKLSVGPTCKIPLKLKGSKGIRQIPEMCQDMRT